MNEAIGAARLAATNRLIEKHAGRSATVLEIGANDASFKAYHTFSSWTTVDKFGEPDVRADLDGPAAHLPFADESVDCVICTEVLEHLTAGTPLVREIGRVLKPGGVAIVSVPNICSLKSRIKVLFGRLPNLAASGDCGHPLGGTGILVDGSWVAAHVVDFNVERLQGYLARGGLSVVEHARLPTEIRLGRSLRMTWPASLLPANLCDFILVAATREGRPT